MAWPRQIRLRVTLNPEDLSFHRVSSTEEARPVLRGEKTQLGSKRLPVLQGRLSTGSGSTLQMYLIAQLEQVITFCLSVPGPGRLVPFRELSVLELPGPGWLHLTGSPLFRDVFSSTQHSWAVQGPLKSWNLPFVIQPRLNFMELAA